MPADIQTLSRQFRLYARLGWFDRWRFRRALRWVSSDPAALKLLFDFDQKLPGMSLPDWSMFDRLYHAVEWYNREARPARPQNRSQNSLPQNRLAEMLQVVIVLLNRSPSLHRKYRDLILNIVYSADKIKAESNNHPMLNPEQFRLAAAGLITSLTDLRRRWERWHPELETRGNLLLKHLETIAGKISEAKMFARFSAESASAFSARGLWSVEPLRELEKIAGKVPDLQALSEVLDEMAPAIGLKAVASLLDLSQDFQEWKEVYPRVQAQLAYWGTEYKPVFWKLQSIFELDRLLDFLENFPHNKRLARYLQVAQTHSQGVLFHHLSGALRSQKGSVLQACLQQAWKDEWGSSRFIETQMDQFEQTVVISYLGEIWRTVYFAARPLRWEFDRFTEYIPAAMTAQDWTKDDEKCRSYWNVQEAPGREYQRFVSELEPRLRALLGTLDLLELEALFALLPGFLSIETFPRTVQVPVEWARDTIMQEGYQNGVGFYDVEVEIARPTVFRRHTFTFERPSLQAVVRLISDRGQIHAAIQAYPGNKPAAGTANDH